MLILTFFVKILQLMAMCVLMFAITHPEFMLDPPTSPSVINNNNDQISVNVVNYKTVDISAPQLPTPLPRRRFSNDNVEENAKMQKSFYTKNEMMFFTQKRIQSGNPAKTALSDFHEFIYSNCRRRTFGFGFNFGFVFNYGDANLWRGESTKQKQKKKFSLCLKF